MKLSVKYSLPAAELLRRAQIEFDLFRCYPRMVDIRAAQELAPVHVHFPYRVGTGAGDAIDGWTSRPVDWDRTKALLDETVTPHVNLHIGPLDSESLGFDPSSTGSSDLDMLSDRVLTDLQPALRRFGGHRVVIENPGSSEIFLIMSPKLLRRVLRESGCGLLLAPSNARLAVQWLGTDLLEHIRALPTESTREIETVGVQRVEGHWVTLAREAGIPEQDIEAVRGTLIGHLPMTETDWELIAWTVGCVEKEDWGAPWALVLKYGGVEADHPDELLSNPKVMAEQVPRLRSLATG
jgi:uncharacterized protein (UPF0276 family)